jgi:ADYC domain
MSPEKIPRSPLPAAAGLCAVLAFLSATEARADRIQSVDAVGTAFHVTLESGRVLDSMALRGAELDVTVPGGENRHVRLVDVEKDPDDPDGEVLLHRMLVADPAGAWAELCQPDATGARWSFPLRGAWDDEGRRVSETGLTLTCVSGAIGKCVRFGYKLWKSAPNGVALAPYHAACVKAVRADYCGDRGTTRNGQPIDIYDALSIERRAAERSDEAFPFEAAFSPSGALCVAHTRVPQNMTLDGLAQSCPRLAGHLGDAACREENAVAGRYGAAMIFIRSPPGERSPPPLQTQAPAPGPSGSSDRPDQSPHGE